MVVSIVEEAPTAVKAVPPLAIGSVPVTSTEARSIVWPKLVKQVPPEAKHPAERLKPLLAVEVAPEEIKIFPPEIVNPLDEESPPALIDATPPAKVEVPLFPWMVVVAVPPTVSVVSEERAVEDAFTNLCKPVQSFELARFKSAVNVPPNDTGEPPIESVEFEEETVIDEFSSSVLLIVWPKLVRQAAF